MLEASGIRKAYGGRVVLDVDDFTVLRGEVHVILGPSGAGKSVFLRVLNLLEPPTGGTIRFCGEDVQGFEGRRRVDVSRRMALIFQDPLLFRGSVGENVEYGLKVRRMPGSLRAARVGDALESVRLAGFEGKHVSTLSGGEAQRVALARALVLEPELLLLDEPFASLDTLTRRELQKEVGRILRDRGMTAVFVTHDLDEAAHVGDRMIILNEGRVVQRGTSREIFYEPSSEFAARFVGVENIYRGVVVESTGGLSGVSVQGRKMEVTADLSLGERVTVGLRPEDVTMVPSSSLGDTMSSRNAFEGEVVDVELRGPTARVTLSCPFPLVALITRRSLEEMGVEEGGTAGVRFKATAVHVMPADGAAGAEGYQ